MGIYVQDCVGSVSGAQWNSSNNTNAGHQWADFSGRECNSDENIVTQGGYITLQLIRMSC